MKNAVADINKQAIKDITGQGKKRKPPRVSFKKDILPNKYIYLMLIPAIIFYFVFSYLPMGGIILAFKEFSYGSNIFAGEWIGFEKFEYIFSDPEFWSVFKNTIIISFGRILFEFPVPIILAILLNEMRPKRTKRVVQTVLTFPHFLSWVIVAGIVKNFLRVDGLVNNAIGLLGIDPIPFLLNENMFKPLMFITSIWKEAGWSAIIFMAAMTNIDVEMYEAATVDGANRFQKIWYITLPSIMGTISFMLILAVAGVMNAGFDQIFNMMNDVVRSKGQILDTYIYDITFKRPPDYSFTTAVGLFKSVINFALLMTANTIVKKMGSRGIYS